MSPIPPQGRQNRPKRLLFVITDLDVGGAEKYCAQLAIGLDRRRWGPEVCCLSQPGAMAEQLTAAGVRVHALGATSSWSAPFVVLRLARLMQQLRPDLVHTVLFHANVVGRLAARLAGVPRVVSSIRVAERRYRHHLVLENLTCRLSQRIVCVSKSVAQFVSRRAHPPARRLTVVPNGVEVEAVTRAPALDRSRLGLPRDAVLAVYVGRLDRQKGVDVLLQALALARHEAPQLHVLLAGAGPQHDSLRQLAQRLRIESNTHFLGWRSDVASLLEAADFFVLPSRWEGMPNAVLEAMAAGLPVVATRTEGTTELVRDSETGLLVPIDDPSTLACALVRATRSGAERAHWGAQGRELVRREFSLARMIERYEEIYDSVCRAGK